MKKTLVAVGFFVSLATAALAQSDEQIEAYVEMLRADVRAEKVSLIKEFMEFTDDEAEAFWPIYRSLAAATALKICAMTSWRPWPAIIRYARTAS